MKKIGLVVIVFLCAVSARAQSYQAGDNLLNVGIGLGSNYISGDNSMIIPPLVASYEFGVHDAISVGPYINFLTQGHTQSHGGYDTPDGYVDEPLDVRHRSTDIRFGARGSYHFGELLGTVDQFDPYATLGLGFHHWRSRGRAQDTPSDYNDNYEYTDNGLNYVEWGISIGARYWFSNLGAWMEIGVLPGIWAQAGLAVKL